MNAFEDPDGDDLTWSIVEQPGNLTVTIDHGTGQVTFEPRTDWFGEEEVTFSATDGEFRAHQTVTVMVSSVNDIPTIATVDDDPVTGDTMGYTIGQGETLVITYTVADVEGDEIVATLTTSAMTHDEEAGTITYTPGPGDVGTVTFTLRINDLESPNMKVSLDFIIEVENRNDPMDDPRITNPVWGDTHIVNESINLIAVCDDPDIPYGQALNFSWSSNISGHLGFGSSLSVRLTDPGTHLITLTVSDGEFEKTDTIEIHNKPKKVPPPPPPPPPEEDKLNWVPYAGIVAVLVVVGAILFVVSKRRRTEALEAADEEDYRRDHMERTHEAVKTAADHLEAGQEEIAEEAPVPETASLEETIEIEGSVRLPTTTLTMETSRTEAASEDTTKLWSGIEEVSEQSEEEREQLRIDNLKRQYQNAIGRLPYGIPSKELADREWVDLAATLATGEKKTVEGGKEVTSIDDRWYYSDHEDTGSFLKEHGAKPKEKEPVKKDVEPTADNAALLAKLEERFILGEISEDAYNELKRKYS
jgi:hypothetical protein